MFRIYLFREDTLAEAELKQLKSLNHIEWFIRLSEESRELVYQEVMSKTAAHLKYDK